MWYEINVTLNGRHFFATDKRSILTMEDCKKVLTEIMKRFPEKDGFGVSVAHIERCGHILDVRDVLNSK